MENLRFQIYGFLLQKLIILIPNESLWIVRDNCYDYTNGSTLDIYNFVFEIWNTEIFFFEMQRASPPAHLHLHEAETSYFIVSKDQQKL